MPKKIEGLAVRRLAAERLCAVLGGLPFTPFAAGEIADARDRAFANRLVTAALRRQGHLNLILKELLERGVPKRSGLFEAAIRLGLTELLFLDSGAPHSALFLAVELVKSDKKSAHLGRLTNGVLRQAQREAARFSALPPETLFPQWLVARWTETYGAAALQEFAQALLAGAPLDVTFREEDQALVEAMGATPVAFDSYRVTERNRPVAQLPGYAAGRFWVQDAASAVPARLFGLPPGAHVLDLCAAPGGKTAQLIKAGYKVTAVDVSAERMERVRDNLGRLGYGAECVVADALSYQPETKFDGVLVDAPCTASGTFRRHPEVLWQRTARDIADRAQLQRSLLSHAVTLLTPGGVLVYASCSLEPEEGEAQADWLTAQNAAISQTRPEVAQTGIFGNAADAEGNLRLTPGFPMLCAQGRIDGFFCARFVVAQ